MASNPQIDGSHKEDNAANYCGNDNDSCNGEKDYCCFKTIKHHVKNVNFKIVNIGETKYLVAVKNRDIAK